MAKYRFSTVERLAIWEAFGRRCAYSREPLLYSDLHVDHILPERLLQAPSEFEKVKDEYKLGADFKINSYYNWIPVHSRLNLQKGGLVFESNTIHYFLAIAKSHYEKAIQLEQKYRRLIEREDVLLPLSAAIEAGSLSLADVLRYLNSLSEGDKLTLIKDLSFCERSVSGAVGREDLDSFENLSVRHGNPHEEGVVLVGCEGPLRVHTCSEFFAAKKQGFYALTTYDMKMESFFNEICGVLNALSRAKVPNASYISNPRVGVVDLDLLPVSILSSLSPDAEEELVAASSAGKTVQDWVDEGKAEIKRVSQHLVQLEHSMHQTIWELLRADFNDDGIEDILVFSYLSAIGGTFGYGDVLTLTRLGPTEKLSILDSDEGNAAGDLRRQ